MAGVVQFSSHGGEQSAGSLARQREPLAVNADSQGRAGAGADNAGPAIQPEIPEPDAEFPLQCLPLPVAEMAQAIAITERMPASLAGCCALGILSAAVGAGLQVESKPGRFTRGNLYVVPSAESGTGKSEVFRHAVAPFLEVEKEMIEQWMESTSAELAAERDVLDAEIKRMTRAAGKPNSNRDEIKAALAEKKATLASVERRSHAPRLAVEDVTTEQLAVLLAANTETLASLSADAGAIVKNLLGRYMNADGTDEGVYLKAFSGDYCRVDRRSRETVVLRGPCLSVLWLVQPDKVETLLGAQSLTDGGLIPRLLICHTHAEPQLIGDATASIPAPIREEYRARIRELIQCYRFHGGAHTIQPTPEALAAMTEYHNAIVLRRRADLRDVTTFAARWAEQAWRIAVCHHAGTYGSKAHERALALASAEAGIGLARWFAEQQLLILSGSRDKVRRTIRNDVLTLAVANPRGLRASDVYRARIVRDADAAHALLAQMEADGELTGRDEKPHHGGHVARIFTRANK